MKCYLLLASLLVLISCSTEEDLPPELYIPDSTMVKMMVDAFVLNAAFADTYIDIKDSIAMEYTNQLMTKYGVTEEQYQLNLDRVHSEPEKLDSIFKKMLDVIDDLETHYIRASTKGQ